MYPLKPQEEGSEEKKRRKQSFYGFSYKRKLTSGNPSAQLYIPYVIRLSGEMNKKQ